MSLARMLTQPLVVQPPIEDTDDYGNTVDAGWGDGVTEYGLLQQTASTEVLTDRDTVTTLWKAYLPAGSTATARSRIVFGDATYQVTGAPNQRWNARLARVDHVEAVLTEVR